MSGMIWRSEKKERRQGHLNQNKGSNIKFGRALLLTCREAISSIGEMIQHNTHLDTLGSLVHVGPEYALEPKGLFSELCHLGPFLGPFSKEILRKWNWWVLLKSEINKMQQKSHERRWLPPPPHNNHLHYFETSPFLNQKEKTGSKVPLTPKLSKF